MKSILIISLLALSISGFAQKIKIIEGSLSPLKGQTSIGTQFTYDNMTIGKDKHEEQAYINRKKEEYDKKEKGRGDKWEKAWVADRKNRFEPSFIELFEKHSKMKSGDDKAKYTLIFKTTNTEPGWNVGVMRAPASIDAEVWIVETANPSKVVAKVTIVKAPGRDAMGYDFDSGTRIQEAYAKSGKEIGKLVSKTK